MRGASGPACTVQARGLGGSEPIKTFGTTARAEALHGVMTHEAHAAVVECRALNQNHASRRPLGLGIGRCLGFGERINVVHRARTDIVESRDCLSLLIGQPRIPSAGD